MTQEQKFYDSNDLLAYILGVCQKKGFSWNLTKAQKLLYCCYGTVLAGFDRKLTEELPQAWKYAPVFPRTLNAMKKGRIIPGQDNGFSLKCEPEIRELIDTTIETFGPYSASKLSNWSHQPGSPWHTASNGGTEIYNPISSALIKDYFKSEVMCAEDRQ